MYCSVRFCCRGSRWRGWGSVAQPRVNVPRDVGGHSYHLQRHDVESRATRHGPNKRPCNCFVCWVRVANQQSAMREEVTAPDIERRAKPTCSTASSTCIFSKMHAQIALGAHKHHNMRC